MEGECKTEVRLREARGIPVRSREVIDLLRASVKPAAVTYSGDMPEMPRENMQSLESCPGGEGRVDVAGSRFWDVWNGVSDLGCLPWKCEPREWISAQSLTQKCQQDQLLAVSCLRKRAAAPNHAEEQEAKVLVGRVADAHTKETQLVAPYSHVVHSGPQMDEQPKKLQTCMENWKNVLSVVASDFGEENIVLEEVSQEIKEAETTLCQNMTGDKKFQREWKEMIPQSSTTDGDKSAVQDLELAWGKRSISPPEELETEVTPELLVLFQRVKVLEHSLRDNVNIFTGSKEDFKNRIREPGLSERKLLVRVEDLMEQAASQSAAVSRQRQAERLRVLREDVQSMRMEKERSERVWKERLRRSQEQLRSKEEEMKMQSDYFEHFKLKQQQKLRLAREYEHALRRRVYELERESVDLTATAALLRAELVRQPCGEPAEQEGWEQERDKLNVFISGLQEDLRELLGCEEVGQEERRALLERLQAAEDNGEFLSHRLEDLRSRVQQLRLAEGRLQAELEELAEENAQLHRGRQTLPGIENGPQEAVPKDGNNQTADITAIEKLLQLKWEAVLDPARTKGVQTPSMTQCIREAIVVSKLIPEISRSQSCSHEGFLEISFLPLLETNSLSLAEIMQTLRCGGEEQVHQNMEQLESFKRALVSWPGVVDHSQSEEGCLSLHKEVMAVPFPPDLVNLFGSKFQNSNIISLVSKTTDVDCNSVDNDPPATELSCSSYTSDRFKPTNEEIKLLNEAVHLQSETVSLSDSKKELESLVHSKEEALQRLSEENPQLQRSGTGSCYSEGCYEDPVTLSCEKDEMRLETLKNNWRQENKVLGQRNEELLGQLAQLEGEHERELAQLRLQMAMLEKEVARLEEENKETCCAAEEDQKAIKELQDALWRESEEVGTLRRKQVEDMALIAELRETQCKKTEQSVLLEDVTSRLSCNASAGNWKEPQVEETKENEQQKVLRMSSDAQTLRNGGRQEVTSPRSDSSTLSVFRSTSVEGKNLKEEGAPDTGMTSDAIQQHPAHKEHLGTNNGVKQSVQKARAVFRLSTESQKPTRETDVSPQNNKVTQQSHTTIYSYKTVNLETTLQERSDVAEELNNVRKELGATVADLQQSQECLDRAKSEAQKWYRELGLAESRREEAEKKASQALNELKRVKACLKESEGKKKENSELKDEVEELRRQMTHLEKEHVNAVSMSARLEEKLVSLLTCLDAKCGTEDGQMAKNLSLEGYESALETWCDTIKTLKVHYDDIKYQFEELHKKKTQCDLDMAPLKARLACVVQKCRERNSLIVQLVRKRCRCGCIRRSLMQEAEDLVNDTALLEYSSAFGPTLAAVQDNLRESLEAGRTDDAEADSWSSAHGSLMEKATPLSYRQCVAKTDYCPSPDMPQTALPILPLSAGEEVQVAGAPDSRGLCRAEVKGESGLVPACFLEEKDARKQSPPSGSDPAGCLAWLTGPEKILEVHRQLQRLHRSNYQILPLTECNAKPELGPFSVSAQIQSQHALCGLSEASGAARSTPPFHRKGEMRRGERQEPQQERKSDFAEPVGTAAKDEPVMLNNVSPPGGSICRAAAEDRLPDQANMAATPNALSPEDRPLRAKLDPPAPVVSLKVMKTVGQSGLMIGWDRPPLDELGCSNGTFVCGYRVYVEGEFHKSVMSSACTKAVLENLDLSVPVHISVQTLGSNGLLAEKVHVLFEGSWPPTGPASTPGSPVRRWHTWTSQPVTSRAPVLKQPSLKSPTEPALCVAVYNYSPLKDSPNIHPSRELAFREGEAVWVFGEPRRDGFCDAEVNGTRGLAPMAFLEEISSRLLSEEGIGDQSKVSEIHHQ
ncbi:restin homolog isoform X3 [Brienomyrus brachyistius]|uniref:restin homolog isoform X3 n=1 Tax=Brienomyrus brachyistius TaxID=42636 RepID=UPI0020B21604|nr:restin homolog isoform X3 [Brienomyrus brachyistius]